MKRKLITFAGGLLTATIGQKVLKSDLVHKNTVKVMAGAISLKDDIVKKYEDIKEDAQDLAYEAKQQAKKEEKFLIEEESKCEE